jgi:3-deoxy-D-manno-octulosonate 8-phosphate phosphatase (KDO 8-P phosphatase)
MEKNFKEKLQDIKAFFFDVDGVLTNGQLMIMPGGELLRSMNIKDGYAMQLAIKKNYVVAIISGGKSEGVPHRLSNLGITEIHMQVKDKMEVYNNLKVKYNLTDNNILMMGDEVKHCCIYQSQINGGEGCVRDIIEQTLTLHGNWNEA